MPCEVAARCFHGQTGICGNDVVCKVFKLQASLEPQEGVARQERDIKVWKRIQNRSLGGVLIPREHREELVDGNPDRGVFSICDTARGAKVGATGRNRPWT